MPSRNIEKIYVEDCYYHVYNRGVNKRKIFIDDNDFAVFLNLLKRYLDVQPVKDSKGREYDWLREKLDLLAYCLMPNHFHLLVYQSDAGAMTRLMRGVCTSYTAYFNKRYNRIGPLFQERYKASMIESDEYLQHISRYIHLNPIQYKKYEWSSLKDYLGKKRTTWLVPDKIISLFEDDGYKQFISDYKAHKDLIDYIKSQSADF